MLKKLGKFALMLALIAGFCWVGEAAAANAFGTAAGKLVSVFKNVRTIVFILGAFALVGFAVAAILGNLAWKKVAILAAGLAVLAIASSVITYVTKDTNVSGKMNNTDVLNTNENF